MERKTILVAVGVVLIAAVAWLAYRPTGLRIGPLRVVPPAPGECIGRVEATVVNGTSGTVRLGKFWVLKRGDSSDGIGDRYPLGRPNAFGSEDPQFVSFEAFPMGFPVDGGQDTLEPGASRVVGVRFVRVRGGAMARFSIRGQIGADKIDEVNDLLISATPVEVDPAAWPLPVAMGPEALDRALGEGHELSILLEEAGMPHGPRSVIEIGPGGRARGGGTGEWDGRPNSQGGFRAEGTLTPKQQASLRAAVRAAPFSAFRLGPYFVCDGHQVRLLVAAGSAVFAADGQAEEFVESGLGPLLEHLRALLRDRPDTQRGR